MANNSDDQLLQDVDAMLEESEKLLDEVQAANKESHDKIDEAMKEATKKSNAIRKTFKALDGIEEQGTVDLMEATADTLEALEKSKD